MGNGQSRPSIKLPGRKFFKKRPVSVNSVSNGNNGNSSASASSPRGRTEQKRPARRPPPPTPPEEPKAEPFIVRALYDFNGSRKDDLLFKKGDRMEVEKSKQREGWWVAKHLTNGQQGFIPSNYVCKDDNSPEAQEWWYDIDRKEADKLLLLPGNKAGTFLVRKATDDSSFALSIRSLRRNTDEPQTYHYRIKQRENGTVFIHASTTFSCLKALVEHYKTNEAGLCCQLTEPCPRILPVRHFEELEVGREAIKMEKKLGAGNFGEVWEGRLYDKVEVAIKTLKEDTMSPDAFLQEAKVMNHLRHPKLVQLLAVCSTSEPFLIISELCVHGSLLEYLRQDKGRVVRFPIMVAMAAQIADGMAYLEKNNFAHRDLRAANILVGEYYEVKVADFGLARFLQEGIYTAQEGSKYPIKWTAPEAMQTQNFSSKTDVWSFGVVLYEIITCGTTPYPCMSNLEVLRKVSAPEHYRLPKPSGRIPCPDSYYNIMLQCWNQRPEDRPTFEHLHNIFDDYFVTTEKQYDGESGQ